MSEKEYVYTAEFFKTAGIGPFVDHVRQYVQGARTVPVSRTKSLASNDIFFTFSDTLLNEFLSQKNSIKKPYEVALKYGFRGYSTGGKNGIFLIGDGDTGLIRAVKRLSAEDEANIRSDLDFKKRGLDDLRKVKIVWHEPSGERVVGVYNTDNDRIVFLDFAKY